MATSQTCCHLPSEMLNSAAECADRARIRFLGVLALYSLVLVITCYSVDAVCITGHRALAGARRNAQECAQPHLHSGHALFYIMVNQHKSVVSTTVSWISEHGSVSALHGLGRNYRPSYVL
jgi:hypothetical protein